MVADDPFSKTICSICFEDLKPSVEYLQSISLCGHVFHELCLQQWFEYSAKSKKLTSPVCKQQCASHNACRLYFPSTGDGTDLALSESQSLLYQTSKELQLCKEQLSNEVALKVEALKQNEIIQATLRTKCSELVTSSLECSRLLEELAALKQ